MSQLDESSKTLKRVEAHADALMGCWKIVDGKVTVDKQLLLIEVTPAFVRTLESIFHRSKWLEILAFAEEPKSLQRFWVCPEAHMTESKLMLDGVCLAVIAPVFDEAEEIRRDAGLNVMLTLLNKLT